MFRNKGVASWMEVNLSLLSGWPPSINRGPILEQGWQKRGLEGGVSEMKHLEVTCVLSVSFPR